MKSALITILAAILVLSVLSVLPASAWGSGNNYGGDYNNNCGGYDNNWGWGDHQNNDSCHDGRNGDYDGGQDNCHYHPPCSPVPEPSSLALLGGGLATFVSWVGIRKRRIAA
jgi:hypothetical protein